ncbi:MAG: hypothetical protein AB4352_20950 [Hormoscilla sp.]
MVKLKYIGDGASEQVKCDRFLTDRHDDRERSFPELPIVNSLSPSCRAIVPKQ